MQKLYFIFRKFCPLQLLFLLTVSLSATPSHAATVNLPVATAHTVYGFKESGPFYNIDLFVKWENDPDVTNAGVYAGNMFYFQNGVGGYFGTQKDKNTKKAIFSIWDTGTTVSTAIPNGADACVRFGHEGSGTSCIIPYNWIAGREYRLRIWVLNRVNNATAWGGWIQDTTTGIETMIGTILLKDSSGYQGYGSLSASGISFTEHYGFGSLSCSALPRAKITWRGPYANMNGTTIGATSNSAIANFNTPECTNSTESSTGAPYVTHEVGGTTVRSIANNAALWSLNTIVSSQTITFGTAPTLTVGGVGSVSATATSGLMVTYSSLTPSVCTVSGSTVNGINAGTCTVAANQAGNAGYSAAAQVTQSIQVMQPQSGGLTQTIGAMSFSPSTLSVGGTSVVSATATSGLPVVFSSMTSSICTVTPSQNSLFSPVIYTVTGVSTGICRIAANQAGGTVLLGGTFSAAPQTTQSITVGSNQYDCIFNWAETNFPQYFSPANSSTANYAPYQYRYYAGTGNYMAISSADMNVWVLGPSFGSSLLNVGTVTNFLTAAGCPG